MTHPDMDVQAENGIDANTTRGNGGGPDARSGTAQWVGEMLGRWQPAEVRLARGFAECRGLGTQQLEDLYQETALALLTRPYATEEHLRNALRHGIKHRALNMHRDTRRRTQILAQSAPSMQRVAEGRATHAGPEETTLTAQDMLIVREFLTELDELEQKVFWLTAEGMRYRAIASALQIPVNQTRNASRSCERKRQRFQLLYDTGRLCGYRTATIEALESGGGSEAAAAQAEAHLAACSPCRAASASRARARLATEIGGGAVVAGIGALWGWLRSVAAAGGVSAKATAAFVTAAAVAGGTLSMSSQPSVRGKRQPAAVPPVTQRNARRQPHPPLHERSDRRPSSARALEAGARRQSARPVVGSRPAVPGARETPEGTPPAASANDAQREFGPEH